MSQNRHFVICFYPQGSRDDWPGKGQGSGSALSGSKNFMLTSRIGLQLDLGAGWSLPE